MATWLELRCEDGLPPTSYGNRCWSHDNSGPTGMASDDQKSILSVLRGMHAEARKTGWILKRRGWVCPHCIAKQKREGA